MTRASSWILCYFVGCLCEYIILFLTKSKSAVRITGKWWPNSPTTTNNYPTHLRHAGCMAIPSAIGSLSNQKSCWVDVSHSSVRLVRVMYIFSLTSTSGHCAASELCVIDKVYSVQYLWLYQLCLSHHTLLHFIVYFLRNNKLCCHLYFTYEKNIQVKWPFIQYAIFVKALTITSHFHLIFMRVQLMCAAEYRLYFCPSNLVFVIVLVAVLMACVFWIAGVSAGNGALVKRHFLSKCTQRSNGGIKSMRLSLFITIEIWF